MLRGFVQQRPGQLIFFKRHMIVCFVFWKGKTAMKEQMMTTWSSDDDIAAAEDDVDDDDDDDGGKENVLDVSARSRQINE